MESKLFQAGALIAVYLAKRGFRVDVYEARKGIYPVKINIVTVSFPELILYNRAALYIKGHINLKFEQYSLKVCLFCSRHSNLSTRMTFN